MPLWPHRWIMWFLDLHLLSHLRMSPLASLDISVLVLSLKEQYSMMSEALSKPINLQLWICFRPSLAITSDGLQVSPRASGCWKWWDISVSFHLSHKRTYWITKRPHSMLPSLIWISSPNLSPLSTETMPEIKDKVLSVLLQSPRVC